MFSRIFDTQIKVKFSSLTAGFVKAVTATKAMTATATTTTAGAMTAAGVMTATTAAMTTVVSKTVPKVYCSSRKSKIECLNVPTGMTTVATANTLATAWATWGTSWNVLGGDDDCDDNWYNCGDGDDWIDGDNSDDDWHDSDDDWHVGDDNLDDGYDPFDGGDDDDNNGGNCDISDWSPTIILR